MRKTLLTLLLYSAFLSVSPLAAETAIKSGQTWKDTNGGAINAHGGCLVYHDGFYYWFGEDRTGSACNGVSCYQSADLYNWKRLGLALTPTGAATDACKDIAKGRTLERPKVIYNEVTGKWVMWVHWENGSNYAEARVCVAQSDAITGPYKLVDVFRPNEHDSRDQTLFVDTDGKAYHFCSTNMNTNMNIAQLSDDYLTPTETETKELLGMRYEAPAIFKVGDLYYGLFSGCTGWDPNRGRYAYAESILGTWIYGTMFKDNNGSKGINFCVDDGKETTYTSQSTYVGQVNGLEKAYIYMGDRWKSSNVGASTYVWLPLSMRSGYPTVRWMDSWDLSIFNEMYRHKRVKTIENEGQYMLLEKVSNRFVSRPKSTFILDDDNESSNLTFTFYTTDDPYIYRIKENGSGKFLESVYGSLRLNAEADKIGQCWTLILEEDGCYRIQNCSDGKCLSVSGASTFAGTSLFLNEPDESIPQSFGVYFDSKIQSSYEEADLFSLEYRMNNRKMMEEQNLHTAILSTLNKENFVLRTNNDGSFTLSGNEETVAVLTVIEAGSGRVVVRETVSLNAGETNLDYSAWLSKGCYLFQIQTEKICQTIKILQRK